MTALERSIELLRAWLSPEQRASFDDHLCFYVVGCDTGRLYRVQASAYVKTGYVGGRYKEGYIRYPGIQFVSDDGHRDLWCIAPEGITLYGDVMLAQKIMLETCELEGLAQANKYG